INSLNKPSDSASIAILREITEELLKDRINLLKLSVKKYGNSPASAVLPNLCTTQDKRSKVDFFDMYNS
ncbi:hypothetical protein ABTL37_20000, partial [Acinetobacter baumannii]